MAAKISICIIGDVEERYLQNALSEIRRMVDEVIVMDTSAIPSSPDQPREGISRMVASTKSNLTGDLIDVIVRAIGDWILILSSGEELSGQDYRRIRLLCETDNAEAYQLIFPGKLAGNELSRYEWLGNSGKFSRTQVTNCGYIPTIGIRLFKKSAFRKVRSFHAGFLFLELADGASVSTCSDIRIMPTETGINTSPLLDEKEQWERDRRQFLQEEETISEKTRSFLLFGPGNIGYSLISERDLPSLEAGLDLGFGRVAILKWALHNLIEDGNYPRAVRFADRILHQLPENRELFEIWHLRGIALFHLLDLTEAEKSMRKALDLNGADMNTLSDLARIYIVSGKLSEARMAMDAVSTHHGLTAENGYIYRAIKQNDDQRATASLLIICRDEEQYIGRMLKSVQSLFDEIVAVDTGSQDRTIDILIDHGIKVLSRPWNDDFAEARNYGLSMVSSDYVFYMDADEYLEDKDRLSFLVFKNLLPLKEKTAVVFNIHTLNGDYDIDARAIPPTSIVKRTALFPNSPEVQFSGKVFESVDPSLQTLHTPLLFAENISIKHHSRNDTIRNRRKIPAMERSADDFDAEKLFEGIQFWMDVGDVSRAMRWFERAVGKADGDYRYLNLICKIFDEFKHDGTLDSGPHLIRMLVSHYDTSYRVATLCADYLYDLKEYDSAIDLLRRLVYGDHCRFTDELALADIYRNRLHYAIASLERDDFATCDAMIAVLAEDVEMADVVHAVSFYKAIRMRELDSAIALLDQWIRERNIPITGTLDNFADFIRLIADFSEIILKYGSIDAAAILTRSADCFAARLAKTA